jgi:hypothetical protein
MILQQENRKGNANRLVISKVVPKIWSCVKSAILEREDAAARHRVETWGTWKYQKVTPKVQRGVAAEGMWG